jgi:hypothetical protein
MYTEVLGKDIGTVIQKDVNNDLIVPSGTLSPLLTERT